MLGYRMEEGYEKYHCQTVSVQQILSDKRDEDWMREIGGQENKNPRPATQPRKSACRNGILNAVDCGKTRTGKSSDYIGNIQSALSQQAD